MPRKAPKKKSSRKRATGKSPASSAPIARRAHSDKLGPMIISDEDFAVQFRLLGCVALARKLNISERTCASRRRRVEQKLSISIESPTKCGGSLNTHIEHAARYQMPITDGRVIVGSDAHYWPGEPTTSHRAFCLFIKRLKIKHIIVNGDVIDGASISRHPPIGWESAPTVQEELETAQERMHEIEQAAGKGAELVWTLGNHDARFETRLASVAPEFRGVHGIHLKDHFSAWNPAWSVEVGGPKGLIVKHRWKGGVHAAHNNTMGAGRSIATGHTHSLKVTPYSDYNGIRYGIETGTMSRPDGEQYSYTEDNPKNWREGFILLTFKNGELLWPEIVHVLSEGRVQFRGEVMEI